MKKQLLIAFGLVLGMGTVAGCSAKEENKNSQEQVAKKELTDEEIVKESFKKFIPDKNLELEAKIEANIQVLNNILNYKVLSNIKVDDKGNILKEFLEEESTDKKETKKEKVFLKKVENGYEKYNVVSGTPVKEEYSEDTDVISSTKLIFIAGDTLFNSITEKTFNKANGELTVTGKIKLKDLGEKLFFSLQDIAPGSAVDEANFILNNSIPLEIKIDANTQEVKNITLKFADILISIIESEAKEDLESATGAQKEEMNKALADVKKNTKGEVVITRKIDKIEEIKFN